MRGHDRIGFAVQHKSRMRRVVSNILTTANKFNHWQKRPNRALVPQRRLRPPQLYYTHNSHHPSSKASPPLISTRTSTTVDF